MQSFLDGGGDFDVQMRGKLASCACAGVLSIPVLMWLVIRRGGLEGHLARIKSCTAVTTRPMAMHEAFPMICIGQDVRVAGDSFCCLTELLSAKATDSLDAQASHEGFPCSSQLLSPAFYLQGPRSKVYLGRIGQSFCRSKMSVQADPSPADILQLPSTWLARLVQHVASGADGLASAAALSQTCKSFYALSDNPAVTYRNIHVKRPLFNPDQGFWQWLAKRHSRIAGLTAEVHLFTVPVDPERQVEQLQMLFAIPGLHLTLRCDYVTISSHDDPFMTKVLRPYGHLVDQLMASICMGLEGLTLQDFCKAAAPCRRLELNVTQLEDNPGEPLNMGSLQPVAASLVRLNLASTASTVQARGL